jgi:hypothetical protein
MAHDVGRDPFARGAFRRECQPAGKCAWCGQHRRRLYSYVWISGDCQSPPIFVRHLAKRHFCSFRCFEYYFS